MHEGRVPHAPARENTSDQGATASLQGLASVALLKTYFDKGVDHLDLFLPFALDAARSLPRDSFDTTTIQGHLRATHGIGIPLHTLRSLLKRGARRGYISREAGRWLKEEELSQLESIAALRAPIEAEQQKLAEGLIAFGSEHGYSFESNEAALLGLVSFLAEHHLALLEGYEAQETVTTHADQSARLVARFVQTILGTGSSLEAALDRLLHGFVLQNALLLKDLNVASRQYHNLTVFLDTRCAFRALGLEGDASKIATREALDLLRATGARVAIFDVTLHEIRSILAVFERKLGSQEGRESLHPTALSRHVLTNHYSPSDIRQVDALLERNLEQLDVRKKVLPLRQRDSILGERELTLRLTRPGESELEPRVVHDVDCIASVLTLRKGRQPKTLDRAEAIFVTTNGRLVGTVREWFAAQGQHGQLPIIHQIQLTNHAWLKKPAAVGRLKAHELAALCAAALRPSRETWHAFRQHLTRLRDDEGISSDEVLAIVASRLTDDLLSEAEDLDDLDAATIREVIERVRTSYSQEAEERVKRTKEEAAHEIERTLVRLKRTEERERQLELRIRGLADRIGAVMAACFGSLLGIGCALGILFGLPGALRWLGLQGSMTAYVVFGLFVVLSIASFVGQVLLLL